MAKITKLLIYRKSFAEMVNTLLTSVPR